MDIILDFVDDKVFDKIYADILPRDNIVRQLLSLYVLTTLFGGLTIIITDSLLYFTVFDRNLEKHPKFLKNQVWLEIKYALWAVPYMTLMTAVVFLYEVRGYSKLYDNVSDHPWGYWFIAITCFTFILFTDFGIYWIHRWLHIPAIYGRFHKQHHKWLVCTPFASHAFHPIDGFAQSLPYHIYIFLFPMHKWTYLFLFAFVNTWSSMIHDEYYIIPKLPKFLTPIINGSAHHTDHHMFFNYNFGQYTTLWDRLGGSYKEPSGFIEGQSVYDDLAKRGIQTSRSSIPVAPKPAGPIEIALGETTTQTVNIISEGEARKRN